MPVYFIQAGHEGPVKIGVAVDVMKRLALLQTGSAVPLYVRHAFRGSYDEERALHARFAHLRLHGEWFGADVLAMLPDLPRVELMQASGPGRAPMPPALKAAVIAAGGKAALARRIGVVKSAIGNWRRAGRVPAASALKIEAELGIPARELAQAAA